MSADVPHAGGAPKRMGRPPGSTRTDRTAVIPVQRVTPAQREKFDKLGGSEWLRAQIDKARI